VNLASRLEGLNKQYGTSILVSDSVYQQAQGSFQFRLLDRVAVSGKQQAVTIYELLALADGGGRRTGAVEAYESALRAYWSRDFSGAIGILGAFAADPPSVVLVKRCQHLIQQPPPPEWDGVYVSMSK
jgi:adenylate cyclase